MVLRITQHPLAPTLISSSSPVCRWTTGPAASCCSRSARRAPARRWRSPGTWRTRPRSRRWSGRPCRGGTAAAPRGTSPCSRRWVAPRRRARRWSWRSPGSWCCCAVATRSWRPSGRCLAGRGTPTGRVMPPPCGRPGSAGSRSPDRKRTKAPSHNELSRSETHSVCSERHYLSCHQHPDQQVDDVQFTDLWLQGDTAPQGRIDIAPLINELTQSVSRVITRNIAKLFGSTDNRWSRVLNQITGLQSPTTDKRWSSSQI